MIDFKIKEIIFVVSFVWQIAYRNTLQNLVWMKLQFDKMLKLYSNLSIMFVCD